MSISNLFRRLGAPLTNNRWSWGAQRPTDGAVILRVWQDLKFIDNEGRIWMLIFSPHREGPDNSGYEERRRHTDAIRRGASSLLVMCTAKDVNADQRRIDTFDEDSIRVGGEIIQTPPNFTFPPNTSERAKFHARYGATWVRLAGRKDVADVIR